MSSDETVCITSSGSIIVDDHDDGGLIQLPGSTSNLTITNDGTLQVGQYDGVGSSSVENNAIRASGAATNVTITNSGVIAASGRHAINLKNAEGDITVTNNAGAIMTCLSDNANGCVNLSGAGNTTAGDIKITNAGTIISQGPTHGRDADRADGNAGGDTWSASRVSAGDYTGYSIISHHTIRLENIRNGGTITVDNSGTIESQACCALDVNNSTDVINVTNSGTIKSITQGSIQARGTTNFTLTNSGTITGSGTLQKSGSGANVQTTIDLSNQGSGISGGENATIVNSGTIEASGNDFHAISIGTASSGSLGFDNVTITNSGTIAGDQTSADGVDGHAIRVYEDSSGTTINIKEKATFTGGVDLGKTESTIVLDSSITKDITLQVYNYDGDLTITNNLTGNDTYSITEEDLDSDGTADDGTLTILGEDLEVDQDNQEYRGENTLTKLRGLFNAANYVGGTWPDYCATVDSKDVDSELDQVCNQRFVKLFHSYQTRDKVYDGTSSGVVGMLSPIKWKGFPLVSNIFVGYANQEGDFNNGEYLGGDNYVLGFKNTYENKGFKASLIPMIGVNDLGVIDYDTDKVQTVSNNFLSEFAAVNGKIKKKIVTGENRSLNVSIETTYGLQRFPDYLSKFTDGDLSVDESIEQLLSGGFEVSYIESLPGNFVIKPYFGANLNKNLTGQIKIIADGENKNVSPVKETWSGYHAGVSLVKEVKGLSLDLDLMYGNEDGLINQIAAFSLTKSFGKAKIKTAALEKTPDFPKIDESLTTQDYDKDLKDLEALRNLNKKLETDNTALKAQNEKLKSLAEKALQQNKVKEKLVVELLKENEKLKLNNQIFKNRILENENESLLRSIEEEAKKSESNKLVLLYFLAVYITTVLLLTSLSASLYNKIRYGSSRQAIIS